MIMSGIYDYGVNGMHAREHQLQLGRTRIEFMWMIRSEGT